MSTESGRRRRSGMFFASDVRSAAETAAYALECHGLAEDQVEVLADRIEEAMLKFFDLSGAWGA